MAPSASGASAVADDRAALESHQELRRGVARGSGGTGARSHHPFVPPARARRRFSRQPAGSSPVRMGEPRRGSPARLPPVHRAPRGSVGVTMSTVPSGMTSGAGVGIRAGPSAGGRMVSPSPCSTSKPAQLRHRRAHVVSARASDEKRSTSGSPEMVRRPSSRTRRNRSLRFIWLVSTEGPLPWLPHEQLGQRRGEGAARHGDHRPVGIPVPPIAGRNPGSRNGRNV